MKKSLTLMALIASAFSYGQNGQAVFEDKDGKSSLHFPGGSLLSINTADASFKLSYSYVTAKPFFFGIEGGGKTEDGVLSAFNSGKITPGLSVNGFIGARELFKKAIVPVAGQAPPAPSPWDFWTRLSFGYEGAEFQLHEPDGTSLSDRIDKQAFNGFNTKGIFNVKYAKKKLSFVTGISVGYEFTNNYNSLSKIKLNSTYSVTDTNNVTTTFVGDEKEVRSGEYKTFGQVPLNFDFVVAPLNSWVALHAYARGKFVEGADNGVFGGGLGLYFLKDKLITTPAAGITVGINDFSAVSQGFGNAISVNFVTTFDLDRLLKTN